MDNPISSVLGDDYDLICIECKVERKMRASAYCLACKAKIDPHFKETHPELYTTPV